ncbi:6-phosphogluconolactonase, cycloisomerase 2 family [Burkholderia sp. D7]|nr:6-phosphogluconolactonase, cycloisomerase 2 family [Burkholderia sp. D7]
MIKKLSIVSVTLTLLAACGGHSDAPTVSQLFAQTNDTANAVIHFIRNADGTLTPKGPVLTGGKGTNGVNYFMGNIVSPDALTSNHSVVVSPDGTRLFVANAGDNTVTTFSIDKSTGDLTSLAVSPTGGIRPTSLAYNNGVLYVTHQQGANELGAYKVGTDGTLTSIGQYPVVQQDALPTQVSVSPDGKFVVVNGFLKTVTPVAPANKLLAYPINSDGTLGAVVTTPSVGIGPFGGAFGYGALSNVYATTDAAGTTVSSYTFTTSGSFSAVSGPITVAGQAAPCWIQITPNNQFVYVSNGSGVVSLFSLDASGRLALANVSAATEPAVLSTTSSFANDSWVSPDGKYFYQDYAGDDKIVAYSIGANGTLTKLGEQPANTQSKISLQGLAGT